ncbi:MAG: hypothetical protein ACRDH2_16795, partial [Anaerolineales bacterium]
PQLRRGPLGSPLDFMRVLSFAVVADLLRSPGKRASLALALLLGAVIATCVIVVQRGREGPPPRIQVPS